MLRICSLLVLLLLPLAAIAAPRVIEGPARVVDGDTLDVAGERIRLFGIDAPEARQTCDLRGKAWACGTFATRALQAEVARGPVACEVQVPADAYGRPVAICRAGGRDIGRALVRQGAATAYARYSTRYAADEAAARAAGAGLWQARMVTPEAHRHTPAAPQATPGTCAIKGNVSSKGQRIYHLPGQRDYAATRITPSRGEAWFCSETQARAAGFRRAAR
ncbi:MAG TPA: thermonuclease family protein [Paracoccaceae bacterium]|nr:thermonuclease family protein [Paracoccaceae bacterium]